MSDWGDCDEVGDSQQGIHPVRQLREVDLLESNFRGISVRGNDADETEANGDDGDWDEGGGDKGSTRYNNYGDGLKDYSKREYNNNNNDIYRGGKAASNGWDNQRKSSDDNGNYKSYSNGVGRSNGYRGGDANGYGRPRRNDYEEEDDYRGGRGGRGGGRGGGVGGGFKNSRPNNYDRGGNDFDKNKKREFYIPPEMSTDENEIFAHGISTGINFSKYDTCEFNISGKNPLPPIETFEELGLHDVILRNLKKCKYEKPTPIQKAAMPAVLAKRDLMACAQTGSGKTAAYLVPIIDSLLTDKVEMRIGQPNVLILAPTRELAIQIYSEATKFAHSTYIKSCIIYGGTSSKHQSETLSRGCHILIATPGRLLDFMEKEFVSFEKIKFVILDEADRMLDMGFKDNIATVMKHHSMGCEKAPVCCMFSATFPSQIQSLACEYLNDYIFICIGKIGNACSDVSQAFYELPKSRKRNKLMEILMEDPDGTLVFVETKRGTDFLASFLSEKDIPSTSIHGDRLQSQREEALRDFRSGRMKILIATNVAARGLDIKNVRHVINYDLPDGIDEYVHRIGRTGRIGNKGRATSFFDPEKDIAIVPDLIRILEAANEDVPAFLRQYDGKGGAPRASNFDISKFGGRDIRYKNQSKQDQWNSGSFGPVADEPEEMWDD